MINSRDINMLHPTLQRAAKELIARMAAKGYPVLITSTYRDIEQQDALYAQGRTTKGVIVTNSKGGQSIHNYRLAFDIAKNVKGQEFNDKKFFETAGSIAREMGLSWGGDWKGFVDLPHIEFTNGLTLAELQKGAKVPEDIKLKWEKALTTDSILKNLEQKVAFDKVYWKNVFDGKAKLNPIYLKIMINRLLGKDETGNSMNTENVLNTIKKYTSSTDYWKGVLDGTDDVNIDWLKALLDRIV